MKIVELKDIDNDLRLYNEEVDEIIKLAEGMVKANPEIRMGQALFHHLNRKHRNLADLILNTTADPFYDDNNINKFLKAITKI